MSRANLPTSGARYAQKSRLPHAGPRLASRRAPRALRTRRNVHGRLRGRCDVEGSWAEIQRAASAMLDQTLARDRALSLRCTSNASAAGLSLCADALNLLSTRLVLALVRTARRDRSFLTLTPLPLCLRSSSASISRARLNGIMRISETGRILTVFTVAAVFAIALFLTAAETTARIVS